MTAVKRRRATFGKSRCGICRANTPSARAIQMSTLNLAHLSAQNVRARCRRPEHWPQPTTGEKMLLLGRRRARATRARPTRMPSTRTGAGRASGCASHSLEAERVGPFGPSACAERVYVERACAKFERVWAECVGRACAGATRVGRARVDPAEQTDVGCAQAVECCALNVTWHHEPGRNARKYPDTARVICVNDRRVIHV